MRFGSATNARHSDWGCSVINTAICMPLITRVRGHLTGIPESLHLLDSIADIIATCHKIFRRYCATQLDFPFEHSCAAFLTESWVACSDVPNSCNEAGFCCSCSAASLCFPTCFNNVGFTRCQCCNRSHHPPRVVHGYMTRSQRNECHQHSADEPAHGFKLRLSTVDRSPAREDRFAGL